METRFQKWLSEKSYEIKEPVLNEDGTVKEEGTTPDVMAGYLSEFYEERQKQIEEAIKSKNDELVASLKSEMQADKEERDATLTKVMKALGEQGVALKKLSEVSKDDSNTKSLTKELSDKSQEIKKVMKTPGNGEVEIKALTERSSVANNALGFFLQDITQLGHKERSLYNVLPKVTVDSSDTGGVVRYRDWDAATTVRAAAMVAEGSAFPESTAKFAWYSLDLRKVGDTLPVTEEFFEDEALAAAELEMFLNINVNLEVDNQLVNGDNTGQNLKGIFNSANLYTATPSGITTPNIKDLVIKMRNAITRVNGAKYNPDMLLVNSLTMESLILAKDTQGNYIFDENTGTIGGLFAVVDENVPDNQLLIGDRRYARIYEKTGVVISRGMPNGQFLEDEMTLKARKRMLLLIKNGDASGFLKVTDVDAALVTLAT